jgi:6-pyruvoyltetrahydropterin/6-carboxytetrahydropterin synthase
MDFSVIKAKLCQWLEDNFDHKFLMWEKDPYLPTMEKLSPDSMVKVPFNPTAENIGTYLLKDVAPMLLKGTGCTLVKCVVEETRKCQVEVKL